MEILLAIFSVLLMLSVVLSLVRNDFWIFKLLEYPRMQKLVLILILTAGWIIYWPQTDWQWGMLLGLVTCIIYLCYKIWPYTFLSGKEMKRVIHPNPERQLKIFASNVLQDNHQYATLLSQIRECNPDIVFLLETNAEWALEMDILQKQYPYSLLAPQENTYGLLFYSRLPLMNPKVNYLVKNDIPSIETVVVLPSGDKVKIWGLHPEPPVPHESLYSTAKDKELMKVALMARQIVLPCIVFGDLNDVAWSHTTELFRKTSELLDPRRGRGFYSTFSAHHWFIRYPLDYIFCSRQFRLISMKRLKPNGSDHFATCTHIQLDENGDQSPPQANEKELEESKKMAGKG